MPTVKNLATRLSLLVAALVVCIMPAVSAPFGGGDSGVWILPRSSYVSSGLPPTISAYQYGVLTGRGPRARQVVADLTKPLAMQVSAEVAVPPVAVVIDPVSGHPFSVLVSGGIVTVPARTLQEIAASPSGVGIGVVVDSRGQGYTVVARFLPQHEAVAVEIY